ncbi:MAG: hypothetical protein IKW01_06910 [Firmicutes bacterium]|nr:hypothetical protein [Bacillota bacterium]
MDRFKVTGVVVIIVGIILAGTLIGDILPTVGDVTSPANSYLSPYYIENALHDTEAPNIVTAVLADYRGFDTLFETCVMFLSGITTLLVLLSKRKIAKVNPNSMDTRGISFSGTVLDTAFRIIIPIIVIYAFYVLAHGEISLGGGFQAGALLGIVYMIDRLIPSIQYSGAFFTEETAAMTAGVGVFIYGLTGILPILNGGNFLEYENLPFGFAVKETEFLHSVGIFLIEIGVTVCVMATIINILEVVLERTKFHD